MSEAANVGKRNSFFTKYIDFAPPSSRDSTAGGSSPYNPRVSDRCPVISKEFIRSIFFSDAENLWRNFQNQQQAGV